jgi:hypothetical protein
MLGNLASFHPGAGQSQQDAIRLRSKLQKDMAEDKMLWRGWWARHDYQLEFLGDAVAGYSGQDARALEFVELAAFFALMAAMVREMTAKPRRAVGPVQAVKAAKARRAR